MGFETIRLEEKDGLARITLYRPDRGNAINVRMVDEIQEALNRLEDASAARAVVLAAAGDRFCSGIDLVDFPVDSPPDVHGFSRWEKACRRLERLPKATVAAIDGECAGGGLQLALACDVRVATRRSFFHLHEVRLGFLPGMGTFRLAKFIGLGRARRLALTGRRMDATEAHAAGLVDCLCADHGLEEAVKGAIAEFEPLHAEAVCLIRRLIDESFELSYEDFIGNFLAAQHRAVQSEAFRQRVRAAHERGTPQGEEKDR
jgi:enoyl-CoA hydratase/carnithine racemase